MWTCRTVIMVLFWGSLFQAAIVEGRLVDRVVASINDDAITLREFRSYYDSVRVVTPDITEGEGIQTLINRRLILHDAERMNLEGRTKDEKIQRYISIRIRSFVKIRQEEIREFYNEHAGRFRGLSLEDVSDKIERLLIEREVNRRLREHLNKLRRKAYIRVNLISP